MCVLCLCDVFFMCDVLICVLKCVGGCENTRLCIFVYVSVCVLCIVYVWCEWMHALNVVHVVHGVCVCVCVQVTAHACT